MSSITAQSFCTIVNRLLAREPGARDLLLPYAGRSALLTAQPLSVALTVGADGLFTAAAPDATIDVSITVAADALNAMILGGPEAVKKHVRIGGDAEFAAALGKLAERLRWEPEEDLAGLIGDAPAYRVAHLARGAVQQARRAGRNLLDTLAEYLVEERGQLVRRPALDSLREELVTLRDRTARLEKRIERAERAATGAGRSPLSIAVPPPGRGMAPR